MLSCVELTSLNARSILDSGDGFQHSDEEKEQRLNWRGNSCHDLMCRVDQPQRSINPRLMMIYSTLIPYVIQA